MAVKFQQAPPDLQRRIADIPDAVGSIEGLASLWAFGSRARGEATPLSDVDLAYLDLPGFPAMEQLDRQLFAAVVHCLGTDDITLLCVRHAPLAVQMRVLIEGKPLFQRDWTAISGWAEGVLSVFPEVRRLRVEARDGARSRLSGGKMELDRERLVDILGDVSRDVARLRQKLSAPLDVYLADEDAMDVVARRFQTAVEGCLNVANHIIARQGLTPASDYAAAFRSLQAGRVIGSETAEAMSDMARFRNLVVHLYGEVDHRRIHESGKVRLEALEGFLKEIGERIR